MKNKIYNRASSTKPVPATQIPNKFWNFQTSGQNGAELTLYGDIESRQSWYDDAVTPTKFNEELAALGNVDEITVRINSGGGDVFAAVAIFTRLKQHPANITVIIDGWAASAATIIAMAGNTVKIPAAASFMIHDPALGLLGYYTEQALSEMSNELKVAKDCIINAYLTKSGKSREDIAALMSATTWYTGEQAVEAGFCDEVLFAAEDEDSRPIITDHTRYTGMPKALLDRAEPRGAVENTEKEGKKMEIKDTQELIKAFPNFCDELAKAAAQSERERIQAIDGMTLPGFESIADDAKFKNPQSAADVAMRIVAEQKKQSKEFLDDRERDVEESGMNGVAAAASDPTRRKRDEIDEAIDNLEAKLKAKKS
ncbi:hypothetical protein FACS18949_06580 [Clostridia bacterium]|nr:hypothetical protein FACS18949_06580 [Clostridia bacterium]